MLRVGSTGPAVVAWQKFLKEHGYFRAGTAPHFGPKTYEATVSFQREHNLVGDGIVGPATRRVADQIETSSKSSESKPTDFAAIAKLAGIPVPVLRAIKEVESNGKPSAVRFEPHLFHRHRPDLADRVPYTKSHRGYSMVAKETSRRALEHAMTVDADVAIRSTSFGSYQVLGGYLLAAYPGDPMAAYRAFRDDPDEASDRMVAAWFKDNVRARRAANASPPDFTALAKAYNGPNQHVHKYDERIERAWRKYREE